MKNKTSFFKNKLFIGIVLAVFVLSLFSSAVLAGETYNSSRSNTSTAIMLQDLGVDEEERERIFSAFDDEVRAYANYNDAVANTSAVMKREGVSDEDAERILAETGIRDTREKVVRFKAGADLAKTVARAPVPVTGDTPLTSAEVQWELFGGRAEMGFVGVDEDGVEVISKAELIRAIVSGTNMSTFKAERITDNIMAVSIPFIIDENGLPEKRKAELVEAIASDASLTKADAERALDAFVGATAKSLRGSKSLPLIGDKLGATTNTKSLRGGSRVALVGFGSFSISKRKARTVGAGQVTEIVKEILKDGSDGKSIQRIEIALNDEIQATRDYNTTRSNTKAVIREAGITDEATIGEILAALYEPIRAADATYDAIDQAMVDFPFLGRIFGNERMNVYIGDQEPFNIIASGGSVESLNPGEIGNPTMRVYTDMETVDGLSAGTLTPLDALQQGKISYEGVGFVNSIKFKVLSAVSWLLSKLGIGITLSAFK